MIFSLNYGVVFGNGDSSDVFEWEVELTEKQEEAYHQAIMTGRAFDEYSELRSLCDDAYRDIEEEVLDGFLASEDEYVLECLGEIEVDPDLLNDLVHSKDKHAIEFLGLDGLSDEELEDWDAELDLEEIPLVKDFEEDFEPMSPFDCGWSLNVWLPEHEATPSDERIEGLLEQKEKQGEKLDDSEEKADYDKDVEQSIKDILLECKDDFSELDEYIKEHADEYEGNLEEFAFRTAVQLGNADYVEDHVSNIDLNDGDGCSTYLYETDDEGIQEILLRHGAFRSWDDYEDCRFAVETVNGDILAFDPDFQAEVYVKYKEKYGLTDEDVKKILAGNSDENEYERDVWEDLLAIGILDIDGEIVFNEKDADGSLDGYLIKDILEELGWELEFEGESWKLETIGVFFIR